MSVAQTIEIAALIFVAALVYSSVGHAGASGYLAVMALFALPQTVMRPTALVLNILVAAIGTFQFFRAGHFRWSLFWPFAIGSIPLAFIGGRIRLDDATYNRVLGAALWFAAYRIARGSRADAGDKARRPMSLPFAVAIGPAVGLVSGLVGVGGGIFLSPVILLMGWAGMRQTAATSAAFILVNSIAGLAGQYAAAAKVPTAAIPWAIAAVVGGLLGSSLGSRRLPVRGLRMLLATVLAVAGGNLALRKS
jgi:hypothetical protein